MKFSEIKELTDEELTRKLEDMKEGYMKLRFQHATGQLDNPAKLKLTRRDIAKINTAFSQRKVNAAKGGEEKQ